MSVDDSVQMAEPVAAQDAVLEKSHSAGPTRSWRKKYRKLRHRFTRVMHDSNILTKNEYRTQALARRLQEENDQILELILELQQTNSLDFETDDETHERPSINIAEFLQATASGTQDEYLSTILQMPHKAYNSADIPEAIRIETSFNYLDSAYEEEYLGNLDAQLEDPSFLEDPNKQLKPPASRLIPTEKELIHRNGDSVISWLRRHHPETFIQDKDEKDKPEPKKRGGKRASLAQTAKEPKVEPDEVDEDLGLIPEPPEKPIRGRKSKDDDAYRPKGGNGGRGGKRKRGGGDDAEPKGSARKRKKGAQLES